jgi:PAS domain S-box-containing protein
MLKTIDSLSELRYSGIEIIGDTLWGTHLCNFYDTKQDLLDILVPYFKTGLENNEYCLWITSAPITVEEATDSLRKTIPNFDNYLIKQSIEILPHKDWFLKNGSFDPEGVINEWYAKLKQAISMDYTGMRVNANASWLNRSIWKNFIEYEKKLKEQLKDKQIIALSTYPLEMCNATDLLDVAKVYDIAVTMRCGKWEIMESPEIRQSKEQFKKTNEELSTRIAERTRQLEVVNFELKTEIQGHELTEEAFQKSEANLRGIFDNSGISLMLLDLELNIIMLNKAAKERSLTLFGKPVELGTNILDVMQVERKKEMFDNYNDMLAGKHIAYESIYKMVDGSSRWYFIRLFLINIDDGSNVSICISADDITDRKNLELQREKVTYDLIQRNKDLEQFSYVVSHNLRGPVANLLGFSNMLLDSNYDEVKKRIFIEQLHASAEILDGVIRDLNQILSVKAEASMKKETVQLSGLVNNIKDTIKNTIDSENAFIATDFKVCDHISTIKSYIHSIFYNLIMNSIKYRRAEVDPIIEIRTEYNDGKLSIIFKDNGVGIDLSRNKEKIFGLYKRFHLDVEGKGVGLFMVKTQVEILGGTIHLESEVNHGTQFTINFNK